MIKKQIICQEDEASYSTCIVIEEKFSCDHELHTEHHPSSSKRILRSGASSIMSSS